MASEGTKGEKPLNLAVERVAAECGKAGASEWEVARVVKALSGKGTGQAEGAGANEQKLRAIALSELRKLNPEAAKEFARFGEMRVYTSAELLEPFDRGNITKSLLRETKLGRSVAEHISNAVEEKIKDLKIGHIDTGLIRTLVNAKLLEMGHEQAYRNYERLGLPVHDVEQGILAGEFSGREVMREFSWRKIIPEKAREMHFSNDIFICRAGDFGIKPYAYAEFFETDAWGNAKAEMFAVEIAARMNKLNKFVSLPVCADSINLSFAPLIEKLPRKEFAKVAELFFAQLRCTAGCGTASGQSAGAYISLNIYPEGALERYAKFGDAYIDFANALLNARPAECGIETAVLLDTKYKLGLLERGGIDRGGISFLNYGEERPVALNRGLVVRGARGIGTHVGMNIMKSALEARGEGTFIEALRGNAGVLAELAGLSKGMLAKRDYLKKTGIETGRLKPVLGLFGLLEACGKLAGDSEGVVKLAERAVTVLGRELPDWGLCEFNNDTGIIRFNKFNKRAFGHNFIAAEAGEKMLESKVLMEKYNASFRAEGMRETEELLGKGAGRVVLGD
ncbi:MAG: hypothetical protein ABH854_03995 [Candidatus Diapherotrites archaeon]|nr:hypothetical protein [Candidatus Micrarchaeota archaeon]MBU1939278.1 hypothetical protein [Candidatus Micrarchaeota archaeon]